MSNLTAQDILVSHIQVCHGLAVPAELTKPAVLNEIDKQLGTNLLWFDNKQTAAYVGMQIAKLKPFRYANRATAAALVIALLRHSGGKGKTSPKEVIALIENNSVVDDVADQLT